MDIIAIIKSRRLRWLGHILRKEEESLVRRAWTGRRPLGRPQPQWVGPGCPGFEKSWRRCGRSC